MPQARKLLTNFSKGEASPLLEGRPDLESYFELGSIIENFLILRQGGLTRRIGTRFVAEVKNSNLDTILLTFESSIGESYILEIGQQYMRFYTDKTRIINAGAIVEISSPYTINHIRNLHSTQSVDVMYFFNQLVRQHKLSRLSDISWVLNPIVFSAPPTFDADHEIGLGATTLTPGAVTGTNVLFTASDAVFLEADIGRLIVSGVGVGEIVAFGASAGDVTSPNTKVRVNIRDPFTSTAAIPQTEWALRLSPVTTLNPDIKGPVGATVTLTALANAFRANDVGKYIAIYGGLVRILVVVSALVVTGEILSELSVATDDDPDATAAWILETESWSAVNGYPRTGEFHQGRLVQAATPAEPNVFWLSRSDDFENYTTGVLADDAITYAVATKQLNRIEWLGDNKKLFLGTMGSEHTVSSGNSDNSLGGDQIPLVERISSYGSAPIQPISIGSRLVFVDRSLRKLWAILFDIEEDSYGPVEITGFAEHITESGIRLGPAAFAKNPDPQFYYVRNDGTLLCLTYYYQEKVIGFTRLITQGAFESVAVRSRTGQSDQVWVIVRRNVNGLVKRYIEVFDADAEEVAGRAWTSLQTDCAKLYDVGDVLTNTPLIFEGIGEITFLGADIIIWVGEDAVPQAITLTGLEHLEGLLVNIVADGSVRPSKIVAAGQITLDEPAFQHVEVGLPYVSTVSTMRPTIDGNMLEGIPRNWVQLWVRFFKTIGGRLNGGQLLYPFSPLNQINLFTGDVQITAEGNYDTDGRITVVQDQPYPITILALFGEIAFGEHT